MSQSVWIVEFELDGKWIPDIECGERSIFVLEEAGLKEVASITSPAGEYRISEYRRVEKAEDKQP